MRSPHQKVIKTLMHYKSVHLKRSWQVKMLPDSTLTILLVWLCKRNVAVEKLDCECVLAQVASHGPKVCAASLRDSSKQSPCFKKIL